MATDWLQLKKQASFVWHETTLGYNFGLQTTWMSFFMGSLSPSKQMLR
jgi:hypothetical protein